VFEILVSKYQFNCQQCGQPIKKGESYILKGLMLCVKCGLPERKLKKVGK